jgi:hypothetical protein
MENIHDDLLYGSPITTIKFNGIEDEWLKKVLLKVKNEWNYLWSLQGINCILLVHKKSSRLLSIFKGFNEKGEHVGYSFSYRILEDDEPEKNGIANACHEDKDKLAELVLYLLNMISSKLYDTYTPLKKHEIKKAQDLFTTNLLNWSSQFFKVSEPTSLKVTITKETKNNDEDGKCMVCKTNNPNVLFRPCMDEVICNDCCDAFPTSVCPKCNKKIEKIYIEK